MKNVRKFKRNIKLTLTFFIVLFTITIGYLSYSVITLGDQWYSSSYNPRTQSKYQDTEAGSISDRNQVRLAWTEGEDNRQYAEEGIRLATAHVVGDIDGMTVGAESIFAEYLYGTNKSFTDRLESAMSGAEGKGCDILLTIDAGLSEHIYDNMNGMAGCVVVINYQTGEILANVSLPTFDPTTVSTEASADTSLVDRAVMGRYAPGSLMKIVTMAEAVDMGVDFEYTCKGEEIINGQRITCVKKHGTQTRGEAFSNSCNCYFAMLTTRLDADALLENANAFGFNTDFQFEDIMLYSSNFEISADAGSLAWAAIGQYNDLITPMHAAMIAGAIANDGVMMTPKMLLAAYSGEYAVYEMQPEIYTSATDPGVARTIKEYMRDVVERGTGTSAAVRGVNICGKTGTAEYFDEEAESVKNHSWFAGFLDDGTYPYAVSVIFEGAGYGSKYAAPMAGKVFDYLVQQGANLQ